MIWVESLTNPCLKFADIEAVVKAAKKIPVSVFSNRTIGNIITVSTLQTFMTYSVCVVQVSGGEVGKRKDSLLVAFPLNFLHCHDSIT